MDNFSDKFHSFRDGNPWGSFFILIFFVVSGLFIGQLLGLGLALLLFDFEVSSLEFILIDPDSYSELKIPMYILQGFTTVFGFIVAPLFFMHLWVNKPSSVFFSSRPIEITIYFITFLVVISFMLVNSVFIEWNAQLTLPEFMKPIEEWAARKEQQAKLLTEFLTTFENFSQFLLALLVIAVIPAIGEELLFRGLIQNQMHAITRNIHWAIWITGFLFSAIHLQFYGFIPRMLLGVLFGYMYYWSGNLIIPIIGHFINNAFTLTMLYLYQLRTIDYDLEKETSIPWYMVLISLLAGTLLLIYYINYFRNSRIIDE